IYTSSSLDSSIAGSTGIGKTVLTELLANGNLGYAGKDIAGTINGEAATGSGQLLNSTSGTSKGLKITVNSTDNNYSGSMVFTKGIGSILDEALGFITDGDGGIKSTTDSISKQMTSLDEEISRIDASVTSEMARMRTQFNAMETALNTLKNQGSQLSGLISGLSSSSSSG
ncbi:MAG: flagellar filament capping protein FliD, partial [bacterium]